MEYTFAPPPVSKVATTDGRWFPVRRIFCIGRNYAEHVKEMGGDPKTTPPTFFTKPADAVFTGQKLPYALATANLHYEAELVVALQRGGENIPVAQAMECVFGFAAGCDMTRRDLQNLSKKQGSPWDTAKALDDGAVIGKITPMRSWNRFNDATIRLSVNGTLKQNSDFSHMIWTIPEIIAKLSELFALKPGDLIYTGTPEGVGALRIGDNVHIEIDGLDPVDFELAAKG